MAEFDGLDSRLRDAFAKAAEQGDSTGVADAIRSRIAAGDSGTSVASSTAPGWGGGGVLGWLPWLGLVVLAGIGGTALGASGVVGAPTQQIVAGYTVVLDDTTPAAACPAGPVIGELHAGDRVLAVARSNDSGWLGVRDPNEFARTLWVERAVVVLDAGQPDVSTLPVVGCPEVTVALGEPTPEPTPTDPVPVPQPGPSDTTAPSVLQWWVDLPRPTGVCRDFSGESATVRLLASDNIGVSSVAISWTGVHAGSAQMSAPGSSWSFVYNPPDATPAGQVTFTMVARDAAGNLSGPAVVNVNVLDCPS